MKQYIQVKQQNPDCILFFRIWDFYEVFFEDAKICASILDLIITSKNKNAENPIPMAGIPHHSVEKYIPRLVAKWYKVAIAEQTTDPVPGKIVERSITRIITPWTAIQETKKEETNILAITKKEEKWMFFYHIAWWDFSLGKYYTKTFNDIWVLQKFILQLRPAEIIVDTDIQEKDNLTKPFQDYLNCLVSVYAVPVDPEIFVANVCKVQNISSYWKALEWGRLLPLAMLFSYIQHTQQKSLTNVMKISYHTSDGLVLMDDVTIKNLEIFSWSYEASTKYSLFWILDTTKTAWWSRLLRHLLLNPTNIKTELLWRYSKIEEYSISENTEEINRFLSSFFDVPKLLTLIAYRKLNWVPFMKLRSILKSSLYWLDWLVLEELKKLKLEENEIWEIKELYELLNKALKPDENLLGDQDYIADWYNEEIDQLRALAYHSDEVLLKYQQELVSKTWITNIKLKFVTNQWYFLEITSKDIEEFERFFNNCNFASLSDEEKEKYSVVRRQTLKWNQRYSSPYLDNIQWNIISARDQLEIKEHEILVQLQEKAIEYVKCLYSLSDKIAWLDLFTSHALFAREHRFVKPEINEGKIVEIVWWRHPVIEAFLPKDQPFIPNNLSIGEEDNSHYWLVHIITWPNMWWKSTYLRQSALIVLMTHCWLFVPAQSARIWLVDGIFARVWSWDIIAKNQSTFMTEMIEVSNILNNSTENSFIIFDELWRWTSTYDWLALTRAILHYILTEIKAKTLIATHYHELIALENESSLIKNFSVWVYETEKEVVFMKKITSWWANKSYWVDVAKIAWIPLTILEEARNYLKLLESTKDWVKLSANQPVELFSLQKEKEWIDLGKYEKIKAYLKGMDLNSITPLQALQILVKIKWDL